MSQLELSRRTGIATSNISDWKKKKTNPKADCLLSICDALDITPEQLLTGKGIDSEYKDADMDYEVTRSDIKILKQIHRIDDMKEIPHLICGKTAVGGNYNLTRDSIAVKIKKSAGALKHRRTFALLFCQSKNQTITESDALHGSQHQQAPELWRDQYHPEIPHQWWKQPGDSSGAGHLPECNPLPCCKYPL